MFSSLLKNINKKFLNKEQVRIRHTINITRSSQNLNISGYLSSDEYIIKQLLLIGRSNSSTISFNNESTNHSFNFNLDAYNLVDKLTDITDIYDLYLLVQRPINTLNNTQVNRLKKSTNLRLYTNDIGQKFYEYPIRLGRFKNTFNNHLDPIVINDTSLTIYKTVRGNISLALNESITQKSSTQIDFLKLNKNKLSFGGKLFTRSQEVEKINLIILGRETEASKKTTVDINHLSKDSEQKFGLNRYNYNINLDISQIFNHSKFNEDIYDLYFDIKFRHLNNNSRVRIGNPRFRARFLINSGYGIINNKVFAINPYYTVKRFNLSFQANVFDIKTFSYLKRVMRWSWLLRILYRRKNIWLIGERPYKAQDTGLHLFKHIRKNYKNTNAYYVIEKDSPELSNVKPYGNILYYKSKKHILYTIVARRIISSHHPDYLYPLRTKDFMLKVRGKNIFIQHGVLGTKNLMHFYSKESPSFKTDLFLVSSDLEREIVINDFGYKPKDVIVTGLSRFDKLFKDDIQIKKQVLIIPTWREWLVRDDVFLESEYFNRYRNLIHDKRLHKLSSEYNFEIVLCLHPNMQMFTHFFEGAPVKIVNQGEIDVQVLLKESALMITDYSSVAFDFSFLKKPVIYYQFDYKRFFGKKGSHLDINNQLPGEIAYEHSNIIDLVNYYASTNFKMKHEYKLKADKFLKYKDRNSSERIYQAITNQVRHKWFYERFKESELYRTSFARFRKSKRYFPTMKLFYKYAKKLIPVDEKLILFESGVGKQYSDSPRYIYEEIVNRNLDYKKVWVSNNITRFKDKNTIRITRLSPSYYYYLARAKFWVNNQNFPTYIEKRPETTYIQTWHGTPLKKMLHDIDNVMGRSDDYVERVSKAIDTWDYLISPSSYATQSFKSAFKYDGEILEVGYPRNDIFYHENQDEVSTQVRNRLHLPDDKKIILYAPTFRDNQATRANRFTFDIEMDLHQMQRELGEEYIILLRMHVVITNNFKLDEDLSDFVIDVSDYPEMQELLLVTDILITDYSSVMFDFANRRKPMLFFTYDLETYRDDVRGFYFDFEKEAPGPLLTTTKEIIESVNKIEQVQRFYSEKYDKFYEKYCSKEDGKATDRIVDRFFDKN